MKLLPYLQFIIPIGTLFAVSVSHSRPTAPEAFCAFYETSATCESTVTCTECHSTPPVLNPYGQAIQTALKALSNYSEETFVELLPHALATVGTLDSDGDGNINTDEIHSGSLPGDSTSNVLTDDTRQWDPDYALHKVMLLFCGHSPRYEQKKQYLKESDKSAALHRQLSQCLKTDYWKKEALHRLADKRIRPLYEVGVNGAIGIGNYEWDYRLFSYVLSDDHDARDLLLADYHIDEKGAVINGIIERERPIQNPETGALNLGSGQPLIPEKRVGMISTQWFFSFFTMFADLPRNSASQAYRAYLGLDIAKSEGLMPVPNEPRDVDNKGVDAPECATCHSTLDPLAYAFSAYAGIESTPSDSLYEGNPYGSYYPEGTEWEADSYLFGEPVTNLNDWAQKAANSDAFKKNIAQIFFTYAIGDEPTTKDQKEFETLWQSMPTDNYSANKLIHRLVDTIAFGGKE